VWRIAGAAMTSVAIFNFTRSHRAACCRIAKIEAAPVAHTVPSIEEKRIRRSIWRWLERLLTSAIRPAFMLACRARQDRIVANSHFQYYFGHLYSRREIRRACEPTGVDTDMAAFKVGMPLAQPV